MGVFESDRGLPRSLPLPTSTLRDEPRLDYGGRRDDPLPRSYDRRPEPAGFHSSMSADFGRTGGLSDRAPRDAYDLGPSRDRLDLAAPPIDSYRGDSRGMSSSGIYDRGNQLDMGRRIEDSRPSVGLGNPFSNAGLNSLAFDSQARMSQPQQDNRMPAPQPSRTSYSPPRRGFSADRGNTSRARSRSPHRGSPFERQGHYQKTADFQARRDQPKQPNKSNFGKNQGKGQGAKTDTWRGSEAKGPARPPKLPNPAAKRPAAAKEAVRYGKQAKTGAQRGSNPPEEKRGSVHTRLGPKVTVNDRLGPNKTAKKKEVATAKMKKDLAERAKAIEIQAKKNIEEKEKRAKGKAESR